jgi:hypothetical protein
MRSFATAIVLTTASAMTLKEQLFNEYIARFGKSYKTADEYKMRFNRWKYIDDEIMRIN